MTPPPPPPLASPAYWEELAEAGRAYRGAGVDAIYLVHGTFVGLDALGVWRALDRAAPAASERFGRWEKRLVDAVAKEGGNYTARFAAWLERGLGPAGEGPSVRLVHWSGENHHLGRADGAMRLLDRLAADFGGRRARLVLWGHSHGGNVLALAAMLLGDAEGRAALLAAAEPWLRRSGGRIEQRWRGVAGRLAGRSTPWDALELNLATFGAPVRYSWRRGGWSRLIHFVHDRLADGEGPERPRRLRGLALARYGDSIQWGGVAGTDLPPGPPGGAAWRANRRLAARLEPEGRRRDLPRRWRTGAGAADAGATVAVDYAGARPEAAGLLAGHAVYTRLEWLPFHARQTAHWLAGPAEAGCEGRRENQRGEEQP